MGGLWVVCDDNLITFWTRNGPPCSLAGREGRSLVLWEAPVVMVGSDSARVELNRPGFGGGSLVESQATRLIRSPSSYRASNSVGGLPPQAP